MKTKLFLLIILLFSAASIAQNGINYKAVIKDGSGNIIANDLIAVQFTIIKTTAAGTTVYEENHTPITDANGIIIVNIGEGTPISGVFADIDWVSDLHFLNVQVNTGGGLVDLGTTEFKAVPYALNVTGLEKITENANTGWRLIGRDPANYGDIGSNAVDFSTQSVMPNIGATGGSSFAVGVDTYSTGLGTGAFGLENIASGVGSIVGGFDSGATGDYSFSIGNDAQASGDRSVAFGDETRANGGGSFAMGIGSEASNSNASAFGSFTLASGQNSLAIGTNTKAIGINSVAMGEDVDVIASNSLAVGTYNINNISAAFMVGNGTSDATRNNAFIVEKTGDVGIGVNTPAHPLEVQQVISQTANTVHFESPTHPSGKDLLELVIPSDASASSQFIEMQQGSTIVAAVNGDGSAKFKSVQFEDNSVQTTAAFGPIAYGFVQTAGTTPSGSGNYSVAWVAASNRYEITITGESYFWFSYTTNVTSSTASVDRIRVSSVAGKLLVYLTNTAGALIQGNFQFVTYK